MVSMQEVQDPPALAPTRVNLRGVRVACFFPWNPFEPTGAWTRFSCLWRYLVEAGADVTLPFLEKGNDAELNGIAVRYLGDWNILNNIGAYARALVAGQAATSELKHYSAAELNFLLMYERGLYLNNAKTGPWLDKVISEHDVVTCEATRGGLEIEVTGEAVAEVPRDESHLVVRSIRAAFDAAYGMRK